MKNKSREEEKGWRKEGKIVERSDSENKAKAEGRQKSNCSRNVIRQQCNRVGDEFRVYRKE